MTELLEHTADSRIEGLDDPSLESPELAQTPPDHSVREEISAENWQRVMSALEEDGDSLYQTLWRRTGGNFTLAEQLWQETALKAARNLEQFTDRGPGMLPWLVTIGTNLHNDILRRRKRLEAKIGYEVAQDPDRHLERVATLDDVAEEVAAKTSFEDIILQIKEAVGEDFFDAFWHCKVLKLSQQEYGALIGKPTSTAGTRAMRGAQKVERFLRANPEITSLLGGAYLLSSSDPKE
jgi:DNA-directed RNA polymerase specialized sigma24 family protein